MRAGRCGVSELVRAGEAAAVALLVGVAVGVGVGVGAGVGCGEGVTASGVGLGSACRMMRGPIWTPARSSAGPCGAEVGEGVGSGSEKPPGARCAYRGGEARTVSAIASAAEPAGAERSIERVGARILRSVVRAMFCVAGTYDLRATSRRICTHIEVKSHASSYSLATVLHSRQQRDMESTPDTDGNGPAFLGKNTPLPGNPEEAQLDYVPNPRSGALYLVRFAAPEFTSLCPVTGQPDFAHLVIDYAPDETIVESKSLKLFLGSFRNSAGFHEDVTVGIGQRLAEEMKPKWLRIGGYWYPRGGIPIDVFWQTGAPPEGLWVPSQDVASYRGRG